MNEAQRLFFIATDHDVIFRKIRGLMEARAIDGYFNFEIPNDYFSYCDKKELLSLLTKCGFKVKVENGIYIVDWSFDDV